MCDRHPSVFPPMQQGEAKSATTKQLWRYLFNHYRWTGTLYPRRDNYLALHRNVSAAAEFSRRTGRISFKSYPGKSLADIKGAAYRKYLKRIQHKGAGQ